MSFRPSVAASVLALTLVLGLAPGVPAQVTEITVHVDGLSCPFCAYSLEKKLKAVEGVEGLVIDVKEGVGSFAPPPGSSVDFSALPEAVTKAGFTPREIRVRGVARLETRHDSLALVALDATLLFLLEPNDILATLEPGDDVVLEFSGTVVPSATDDHASHPTKLVLTAAAPRNDHDEG